MRSAQRYPNAKATPATMSKQHSTLLSQTATLSNEISFFRQSRNKLNMFNLFRHCRKDQISFDNIAETSNIVAKNGNNVEATFDFVERTKVQRKTRRTLLPFLATKSNVASILLLVWTGLKVSDVELK